MTTQANRQRRKVKAKTRAVGHVPAGVTIPASLRKVNAGSDEKFLVCAICGRHPCECNQGRGRIPESATLANDPLDDLCGEPWPAVAIYLIAASIAFCGGLGLGWVVWA